MQHVQCGNAYIKWKNDALQNERIRKHENEKLKIRTRTVSETEVNKTITDNSVYIFTFTLNDCENNPFIMAR